MLGSRGALSTMRNELPSTSATMRHAPFAWPWGSSSSSRCVSGAPSASLSHSRNATRVDDLGCRHTLPIQAPASLISTWPVILELSSDARNSTTPVMSSGSSDDFNADVATS